jgi:hypothetical protein
VKADTTPEADETFSVRLTAGTTYSISPTAGEAVATILNDDKPSLSIANASVTEGNAGTTTDLTFTVTMNTATGQTVTVNWATQDATALAGQDYTAAGGTLTFLPGEISRPIAVSVLGDDLSEDNETFKVVLSSAVNANIGTGTATGTINDYKPSLSIANASVTEGNAGTTTDMTFTVTMNTATGQTVTVNWAMQNTTAVAGQDYTAAGGTLTFLPGETSKPIAVSVLGDDLSEDSETFKVFLSNAVNANIGTGMATGTINDDDPLPDLTISDAGVMEGDAGTANAVFAVTLSAIAGRDITVHYAAADGTGPYAATLADNDFVATSGTLTIPAGQTTGTLTVPVRGDTKDEFDETFNVNLANPSNASISKGVGLGTIQNDDTPPTITITDVQALEGDSGTTPFVFTVSLSAPSSKPISVAYTTADGTSAQPATVADNDYMTRSGTLNFAADDTNTSQTVTVQVKGDTQDEFDETFNINLSAPTNATIAKARGVGTVQSDDTAPTLSINDVSHSEGNAGTTDFQFTVSLSAVSGKPITVNWATADGTSVHPATVADADYTAGSGSLTFNPGETTRTIIVAVKGDTIFEADETFSVVLSNVANALLADDRGVGTILNDDQQFPENWTGSVNTRWDNGANWWTGVVPDLLTTAVFDAPAANQPELVGDPSINGVDFRTARWTITGNGRTLTVGAGGFNGAGAGMNAVEPDVALGADSTWTLGNNSTLVLRGMLRGGGHTLTKDGAGTLELAGGQDPASGLAMDLAAGRVRLAPATGPLVLSDLYAAAGAALDLTDNDLILDFTGGTPGAPSPELENVKAWLAAGYAGMTWTGTGITSSAAAVNPLIYGVGYAQNDMLFAPYDSFAGQPVDSSCVLVKYTYNGDLNLDGCVDDNDVSILGLYYDGGAVNTHYWNQGDLFGYDGRIDDNDVSILGLTYGLGVGNPLGGSPVGAAPEPAAVLAPATTAPAAVVLTAAASVAPEALRSDPAALDAGALALLLSKATPPRAAQARRDCRLQIVDCRFKGNNGLPFLQSAICNLQSAIAAPAPDVPLAFSAAEESAPPRPEPVPAPDGGVDLLAMAAMAL